MRIIDGKGFLNDLHKAMQYVETARPIISDLLNGGKLLAVEGSDDEVCKMLDLTCGTDYFQVYDSTGLVWGIASRMQEIDTARFSRPFNTFTVRKARASGVKTEYEKRQHAIKHGGVYPYLTMQGYVDKRTGEIMSLAIAKTTDIMEFVESGKAETRHTGASQAGQAEFYVVHWSGFETAGYKLLAYRPLQEAA